MNGWKKALLLGAALAGLLVAAVAVAALFLPTERIGRLAVEHAEAALDREVAIEGIGLRIVPRPAVSLRGVAVSRHDRPTEAGGATADHLGPLLLSVERIDLRPRLLPLLRGRVVVHQLVVDRPELFLVIPEGGALDLPTIEEEADPDAAEIRIRSVRVRDGRVEYHDGNTGRALSLAGIDYRLTLDGPLTAGATEPLRMEGALRVAETGVALPQTFARPFSLPEVRAEHRAVLVRSGDLLELERLEVSLGDVPVSAEGSVRALSDPEGRRVALDARTGTVEVDRVVRSLPDELLARLPRGPEGARLEGTAGTFSLEAAARGPLGGEEAPEVEGRMALDGVALALRGGDLGRDGHLLVEGLAGTVTFSEDSAATDGLTGRLLGEPFRAAFRVHDFGDPRGSAVLDGALDLAAAARATLLPNGMDARGRVALDVSVGGRMQDPASIRADGAVDLRGVVVSLEALAHPVTVADARVLVEGAAVRGERLAFSAGASEGSVGFEVTGWPALLLEGDETALGVRFDFRSGLLDLDDLLDADPDRPPYGQLLFAHLGEQRVDGRTAAEAAERMGLRVPRVPEGRLDGRLRAARVVATGLVHEDLDVSVTARGGELEIPSATVATMGGRAELWARLGRGAGSPEAPRPLALRYAVSDVRADPFLEHHTLFQGRVGGALFLAGSAEMSLRPDALPVRESLVGEGSIGVRDGELRNWPLVREVGRTVGVGFETLAFQDWTGRYLIAGSRIFVQESRFEGREMGARASGSFDVAGNLDASATFLLPAEWTSGVPGFPAGLAVAVLADPDGRIPIGARVTGTSTAPRVALDLTEVGQIAAGRAREEAERRIRDEAERLSRELGIDLPGPAAPVEADTLRARLENELRGRLRRLIPGGGGERPPGGG